MIRTSREDKKKKMKNTCIFEEEMRKMENYNNGNDFEEDEFNGDND